MPNVDKLGDLFLTSEDGLSHQRYQVTVDSLVPKYKRQDAGVRKWQNEVISNLTASLSPDVVPLHDLNEDEEKKDDGYLSRDYNEAFQTALAKIKSLSPNTRREDRMDAYTRMAHLGDDFNYTVKTYGRIIISEVYLPAEKKTIKPSSVGGIAGGDKYIVQNILFKFAVDSKKMYGSDEAAMKVAGHDLKALTALFNAWIPDLYFPMLSLVNYRGYRLVAMTILPISGHETLVYGSADAGKTIFQEPDAHGLLEELAQRLNLRDHPVGGGDIRMPTPVDLEVHKGTDDKLYLLDFSRAMPPQLPQKNKKMSYLYRHLRPEFVKQYPKRLCSDAFSPFVLPRGKNKKNKDLEDEVNEIHTDIKEASEQIQHTLLPHFVDTLQTMGYYSQELAQEVDLIIELHYYGINVRFLGQIFALCEERKMPYWTSVIAVEMVSRVIKDIINKLLRDKMKEFRYPGEGIYRREVVEFLNLTVADSPSATSLWDETIYQGLQRKFENHLGSLTANHLRDQIIAIVSKGQSKDPRCLIISRLAGLLGLRFSSGMWRQLQEGSGELFHYMDPLDETDLKIIKEDVKSMNILFHSQGFLLRLKGLLTKDQQERKRLLETSCKHFAKAAEVCPKNAVSLRNLADILSLTGKSLLAEHLYKRCLEINPKDTNTLFKYASFLDASERYDEAENYYLKSIEANIRHSNVYCVYADFLAYNRGDYDMAEQFYQAAIATDPLNNAAHNNYAIFLALYCQRYSDAEVYFLKASEMERGKESPRRHLNLASFYSKFKGDLKKAEEHFEIYKVMHASSLKMSTGKLVFSEQVSSLNEPEQHANMPSSGYEDDNIEELSSIYYA